MTAARPKPRGRPADPEARAERRAQILEAAQRCFLRKGFHATTTAELCAEAEISIAGLYQYFPSKEDLILALIELDLADGVAMVAQLGESDRFLDDLEALSRQITEDSEYTPFSLLRLEILAEASRSPRVAEMVAAADRKLLDGLTRALASAQAKGQLRADIDIAETAVALLCITDGMYGRLAAPPAARGPFQKACADLFRRALTPL